MTVLAIIVLALLVSLTAYALERNERRQAGPHSPLVGSSDVRDRDIERTRDELKLARSA